MHHLFLGCLVFNAWLVIKLHIVKSCVNLIFKNDSREVADRMLRKGTDISSGQDSSNKVRYSGAKLPHS